MRKEEIIEEVKKIIRKYLDESYQILLFGSFARKDYLDTSDIDIGILGKKKIPWEIMVKILEEVENIPTLRKIDIVDLKSKSENFQANVLSYAKKL